jgi:uncharacterized membrane protein HdeD (DUF308 family)
VVLVWPFESIAVLTLAAGIWLVIIGIAGHLAARQAGVVGVCEFR